MTLSQCKVTCIVKDYISDTPIGCTPAPPSGKETMLKKAALLLVINLLVFCAFLGILEFSLALLYHFPPAGTAFERAAQRYNLDYSRPILQYLPECFHYSPQTSYRIRPNNRCLFSTREYEVTIHSNQMGLRDDNDSLQKPEIVILGDSQAMGWGVEQHQTIEALLERSLDKKVLNAAIPSFGTTREMKLLSMLDRSNLKTLLIAYNDNDYTENKLYRDRGNKLHIMRPQDYRVIQTRHRQDLRNAPHGKYLRRFWPLIAKEFTKSPPAPKEKSERRFHKKQAALFVNALAASGIDFSGIHLLIVEMSDHNENDSLFLTALQKTLNKSTPTNLTSAHIHTLDLSSALKGDTYYKLGDHLNTKGTRIAAEEIELYMKKNIPGYN